MNTNQHSIFLREYAESCKPPFGNGANHLMLAAANEIDKLTFLLQKAETQIKECDAKIDGLTIDRKYLCEYIRSADSSKYGIICNITSKDLAEPIEKYMEEEVSQKEFETEFGKHS